VRRTAHSEQPNRPPSPVSSTSSHNPRGVESPSSLRIHGVSTYGIRRVCSRSSISRGLTVSSQDSRQSTTSTSGRPVTAIRAGDTDGNDATIADPNWSTFLNTPNLPDYTSTHSVAGGASSEVLRRFFEGDDVPFTTTSGAPFAGITRSYSSFSQAAAENGDSRVYAGIHFRSAVEDGTKQGEKIGHFVFTHTLRPLNHQEDDEDDQ
jgi:hypothetical protein